MKLNRRENTELFIGLILSWLVYAFCQGDFVVPGIAGVILSLSYAALMSGRSPRRSWFNMSRRSLIGIAAVAGGIWRSFIPEPAQAASFIPILLPALQTASIALALIAWFRFDDRWRKYSLLSLSWFTAALSLNVPFNPLTQLLFWLFCCVSVGFILAGLYFPSSPGTAQAMKESRNKSPWMYSFPVLLAGIAGVIFVVLIQGAKLGDDIFMQLIRNYVVVRQLGFFQSTLNLNVVGAGGADLRPILEIDRSGRDGYYLAGQVFEDYAGGIWNAPSSTDRQPVPSAIGPGADTVELTLFEYLEDIIPAPRGVVAANSRARHFEQDGNGLLFSVEKEIPMVRFALEGAGPEVALTRAEWARLTRVPSPLAEELNARTGGIIGDIHGAAPIAQALEHFFRSQFQYSLNAGFRADDQGLLSMLDYQRPAFCSYFASAMTLMLRARGVPARLVGGFLAAETSSLAPGKFLARGRDAHAWVEALLPLRDPQTGRPLLTPDGAVRARWVRFDPTPPDARAAAINADTRLNRVADWIWYTQKKAKVAILNLETKTLVRILFIIMIFVVLEEVFKRYAAVLFKRKKGKLKAADDRRKFAVNPHAAVYARFERDISQALRRERRESETDAELIACLRGQKEIPSTIVQAAEDFVLKYHHARFGRHAQSPNWPGIPGTH